MSEQTKLKYYVNYTNGVPGWGASPSNIPYDAREITYQEMINQMKSTTTGRNGQTIKGEGGKTYPSMYKLYEATQKDLLVDKTGQGSGFYASYQTPWGETLTNVSQATVDQIEATQKGVANGTLKNVGTASKPLYVPTGSPADINLQNPEAYKTAQDARLDASSITASGQATSPNLTKEGLPLSNNNPMQLATIGNQPYQYGNDQLDKKANDAAVNALYQAYFGRNASAAELANWGAQGGNDTTVRALENFLQKERATAEAKGIKLPEIKPIANVQSDYETGNTGTTGTSTTSEGMSAEEKKALSDLNNYIDNMTDSDGTPLSIAEKALLKGIAEQDFTSGQSVPTGDQLTSIIENAYEQAEANLSPHYTELTRREIEDVKTQMEDIRNEAARFQQQEASTYKKTLADTKQNLRSRGMTFSGTNLSTLGNLETAMNSQKEGLTGIEGSLAEGRRMNYEDQLAPIQEQARDLGLAAERQLGSGGLGDQGQFANPYAGVQSGDNRYYGGTTSALYSPKKEGTVGYIGTGDIALDRMKEIEKAKWNNISKYRANI